MGISTWFLRGRETEKTQCRRHKGHERGGSVSGGMARNTILRHHYNLRWRPRGVAWDAVPESMVEYIRLIMVPYYGVFIMAPHLRRAGTHYNHYNNTFTRHHYKNTIIRHHYKARRHSYSYRAASTAATAVKDAAAPTVAANRSCAPVPEGDVRLKPRLSHGSVTAQSRLSHGSVTAQSRLSHGSVRVGRAVEAAPRRGPQSPGGCTG